jgi:hypothetical protein
MAALKLVALPRSIADIERTFSLARVAFDHFMGKLKVETVLNGQFFTSTRSCSACLLASCSAAGRRALDRRAEGSTDVTVCRRVGDANTLSPSVANRASATASE